MTRDAGMSLDEIKQHWHSMSLQFGTDLNATTKTASIKLLEINCLKKAIEDYISKASSKEFEILEVGCGNGINCLSLAKAFPSLAFLGVDYIDEMIEQARTLHSNEFNDISNVRFDVGNVTTLLQDESLRERFDVVFTDRCLINLNSVELQLDALTQLIGATRTGGRLLILENTIQNFSAQNRLRESVGLEGRKPAEYNLFLDEDSLLGHARRSCELLDVVDFGSLHDLMLYVLIPMTNGGKVEYDHPLMDAVTNFLLVNSDLANSFSKFGQNRLYTLEKKSNSGS